LSFPRERRLTAQHDRISSLLQSCGFRGRVVRARARAATCPPVDVQVRCGRNGRRSGVGSAAAAASRPKETRSVGVGRSVGTVAAAAAAACLAAGRCEPRSAPLRSAAALLGCGHDSHSGGGGGAY